MRAGEGVVIDGGAVAVVAGGRTGGEEAGVVHAGGQVDGGHRGGYGVVGGAADRVGGQLAVDIMLGYVAGDVVVRRCGARGRSAGDEVAAAEIVGVVVRIVLADARGIAGYVRAVLVGHQRRGIRAVGQGALGQPVEDIQAGIGTPAVVGEVRVGVGARGIGGRRAGVVIPELHLGGVAVGIQGLGGFLADGVGLSRVEGGDGGSEVGIARRVLYPGEVVVDLGGWARHLLLVVGSDQAEVEQAG